MLFYFKPDSLFYFITKKFPRMENSNNNHVKSPFLIGVAGGTASGKVRTKLNIHT